MKKYIISFLSILLFALGTSMLWADEGGYTIVNYDISINLYENNSADVREVIDVNFTEPRHGIYRYIPEFFYYKAEDGVNRRYKTSITDISIPDYHFKTDTNNDNLILQIGSESVKVSGLQRYEISYRYTFPDDRYPENDFFFYSVLAPDWDCNIDQFNFNVTFENGLKANQEVNILSGPIGNEGNELNVNLIQNGNTLSGTVYNIPPQNAITLLTKFEEGYFVNEKKLFTGFEWIIFVLTIALACYTIFKCFTVKKSRKIVQTVEFYPPQGVTSAEVGMIIDNSADDEDILSLLPYLAKKGYIKIEQKKEKKILHTKDTLVLTKLKEVNKSEKDYVRNFFNILFKDGDTFDFSDLPTDFASDFSKTKEDLSKHFEDEAKLYEGEDKAIVLTMLTGLLTTLLLMNNSVVKYFDSFEMFFFTIPLYVLNIFLRKTYFKKNFSKGKYIRKIIVSSVLAVLIGIICLSYIEDQNAVIPAMLCLIPVGLYAFICIFSVRLIQPTDETAEITGKLMGLKKFIQTAEIQKLKLLVDENPEYFYDVLPYAMVFNLTDKWCDLFKDIEMTPPLWYVGPHDSLFDARSFCTSLNTGITAAVQATTSASSSSGGGFSGGGGGGGGGGSW